MFSRSFGIRSLVLISDGSDAGKVTTVLFFVIQVLGMSLERIFRQLSGKRVGGPWGLLWTWTWILITAQPVCESAVTRQSSQVSVLFT